MLKVKKVSIGKKPAPAAKASAKVPAKKGFPARKPGSKPAKKKPQVLFQPPSDFKPAFLNVVFKTSADSLMSPKFKVERVRGRWDNPDAKKFDLAEYDVPTLVALFSRLNARLFATNPAKRLPKNTVFRVILRVTHRKPTDSLACRVVTAATLGKSASGKPKWMWFSTEKDFVIERTVTDEETGKKKVVKRKVMNPTYSQIRRAGRLLAGAFTQFQLPPSRKKAAAEEE